MSTHIYTTVRNLLKSKEKLVLARIIRRSGSAPRDVGSMCVVTRNSIYGSVGGGSVEFQMVKTARRLLDAPESRIYRFQMDNKDVAESGMICGGHVDLFLETIVPDNMAKVALYEKVAERINNLEQGILITKIADRLPADREDTHVLVMPDQEALGDIKGLAPQDMNYERLCSSHREPFAFVPSTGMAPALFIERIDLIHRVFLFGAGHVSEYVARLANLVGFHVTVIDDREAFANPDRFPEAQNIIVQEFDTVFDQLKLTQDAYVVILTRGHLHDAKVLEKSLGTQAGYIGMIGSTRKRDLIYQDLLDKGFEKADLEKISCPVGVDINAQTPEEIAVSIVAELILKRAPVKKIRLG